MYTLNELLKKVVDIDCSDLHLSVGTPPRVRKNGQLTPIEGEKLSPDNYGDCGGNCSCGTCHVYVTPDDLEKLKAKEEDEIHILNDTAVKPTAYSRLACQVELQKKYNNITVTIAPD